MVSQHIVTVRVVVRFSRCLQLHLLPNYAFPAEVLNVCQGNPHFCVKLFDISLTSVCGLFDVKLVGLLLFLLFYSCACCWAVLLLYCRLCFVMYVTFVVLKITGNGPLLVRLWVMHYPPVKGGWDKWWAETPILLCPLCYTFRETLTFSRLTSAIVDVPHR